MKNPKFYLVKMMEKCKGCLKNLICSLFGFYGISTFVGYSMPNPFLYKKSVLFEIIQFTTSTQFNNQIRFYFKLFSLILIQTIQLSISIDFVYPQLNVKTVLF